ncbi:MAG TPA: NAD(P)H-hydrate dehydratase [Acidimicrobiales bacterium]
MTRPPAAGPRRRCARRGRGPDRVAAARRLADRTGAVVLLKGSLTAVASPSPGPDAVGPVQLAAAGSSRLATAGTGDVLSGIVGAFLARGAAASTAAALAAHVHGRAAGRGPAEGLVAEDLPPLVAGWLSAHLGDGDG